MRNKIKAVGLSTLLVIGVSNIILIYGNRELPPETKQPTQVHEFPPMEIRQIAHAMDLGFDVSNEAQQAIGDWMEENHDAWNAWCELERSHP